MRNRFFRSPDEQSENGGDIPAAPLIGEVSAEQIAAWKSKYPLGIYKVVNQLGHVGYFKNPNRNEVNCALVMNDQPLAPIQELANLTYLGGSDELLKDDTMTLGVYNAIKGKLNGLMTELVNL